MVILKNHIHDNTIQFHIEEALWPEPILPICSIRKLRMAAETPGGPLCSQRCLYVYIYIYILVYQIININLVSKQKKWQANGDSIAKVSIKSW